MCSYGCKVGTMRKRSCSREGSDRCRRATGTSRVTSSTSRAPGFPPQRPGGCKKSAKKKTLKHLEIQGPPQKQSLLLAPELCFMFKRRTGTTVAQANFCSHFFWFVCNLEAKFTQKLPHSSLLKGNPSALTCLQLF